MAGTTETFSTGFLHAGFSMWEIKLAGTVLLRKLLEEFARVPDLTRTKCEVSSLLFRGIATSILNKVCNHHVRFCPGSLGDMGMWQGGILGELNNWGDMPQ